MKENKKFERLFRLVSEEFEKAIGVDGCSEEDEYEMELEAVKKATEKIAAEMKKEFNEDYIYEFAWENDAGINQWIFFNNYVVYFVFGEFRLNGVSEITKEFRIYKLKRKLKEEDRKRLEKEIDSDDRVKEFLEENASLIFEENHNSKGTINTEYVIDKFVCCKCGEVYTQDKMEQDGDKYNLCKGCFDKLEKIKNVVNVVEHWDECQDVLVGLGILNEYGE